MGCSHQVLTIKENERIKSILVTQEIEVSSFVLYSLIETKDFRIAVGDDGGNISIFSFYENERIYKKDIYKEKVHSCVYSLCNLKGNKLVSCGGDDHLIKVWKLSTVELTLIKEIKAHNDVMYKVIPLSKDRFASCSEDKTVKIWKDDDKYKLISTLKHDGYVYSIIQLKGKEELVSSYYVHGGNSQSGIAFWELERYKKTNVINGHYAYFSTRMIELPDGNIVLSSSIEPYPIVIIESSTYTIKKNVQLEGCITSHSSLSVLNEHSFIYSYGGSFFQISSENYSILFKSRGGDFNGVNGIIPVQDGKYCVIENSKCITIVRLGYF